jgi:hypothetical protein
MNYQQQRRLRKHPLIRFLRAIVRIGRLIFGKPKKPLRPTLSVPVFEPPTGEVIQEPIAPKLSLSDPNLTVGEIFSLVQWQHPAPVKESAPVVVKQNIATPKSATYGGAINIAKLKPKDEFITVGELFAMVKWRSSFQPVLEQASAVLSNAVPPSADHSLN